VYIQHCSRKSSPFKARVRRGGNQVTLGYFETAEEAALAYARTPEAQEEVRDAKPKPLTAEEALTVARAEERPTTCPTKERIWENYGPCFSVPDRWKDTRVQVSPRCAEKKTMVLASALPATPARYFEPQGRRLSSA
jgi:hypothetical protein